MDPTKTPTDAVTEAKKTDRHRNKPYVDNYPPLRDFLSKWGARCDWQAKAGTSFVEQWRFPNGSHCIITVHANRNGWDIATPCRSGKIDETLLDVVERCRLAGVLP